ncbi:hypothetical protein HWV62_31647 [Athelia sp. TMB]|nr:hypothetical protein HWV62_31647 [Athelia sp. TMB]
MRATFACLLSLLSLGLSRIAPARGQQAPLGDHTQAAHPLSLLTDASPGVSAIDALADFIATSFSPAQREEVLLSLLGQHDVVDAMRMTGHGAGLDAPRVVDVFGEGVRKLTRSSASEGEKLRLRKAGLAFMDITDHAHLGTLNAQRPRPRTPTSPTLNARAQAAVARMTARLNTAHLRADLGALSAFWTRAYFTYWGARSSDWIYAQVEQILAGADSAVEVGVKKFRHAFPQNSIIARIERVGDTSEKELVIVSAHQDSLNYLLPFYRAPGADDDGSGSVTVLQILRSLVEEGFVPPAGVAVEAHWFAGEEGGLLGSQAVAGAYEEAGVRVRGMLHMDMTAFVKTGTNPIIGFFDAQVDANLTRFATALVDAYLPLPWAPTGCGDACGSDHMSFHKAGFPVAFATEGLFEDGPKNIHTAGDDMDNDGQFSFAHMLEFVKLGIAFVAELSVAPAPAP